MFFFKSEETSSSPGRADQGLAVRRRLGRRRPRRRRLLHLDLHDPHLRLRPAAAAPPAEEQHAPQAPHRHQPRAFLRRRRSVHGALLLLSPPPITVLTRRVLVFILDPEEAVPRAELRRLELVRRPRRRRPSSTSSFSEGRKNHRRRRPCSRRGSQSC